MIVKGIEFIHPNQLTGAIPAPEFLVDELYASLALPKKARKGMRIFVLPDGRIVNHPLPASSASVIGRLADGRSFNDLFIDLPALSGKP